jgi:hypothetical protein
MRFPLDFADEANKFAFEKPFTAWHHAPQF